MQDFGLAEVVFILCIVAGLVGIYINRPGKKYWDETVLDQVYASDRNHRKTSQDYSASSS